MKTMEVKQTRVQFQKFPGPNWCFTLFQEILEEKELFRVVIPRDSKTQQIYWEVDGGP